MIATRSHNQTHGICLLLGLGALGLGLFIARASLPVVIMLLGGAVLIGGVLVEPLIGVGAALVLGPLRAWLEIARPGIAAHVGQIVLLLVVASWLASGMLARRVRLLVPRVLMPLVALLASALVSLWQPADAWAGALEFLKWIQVLLVAVIVLDRILQDPERAKLVLGLLALGATFQAVVGLWQFGLRGDGVEQFAIDSRFYRAYGTFQQPNPYAGLLGLIGALLLGVAAVILVDRWGSGDRYDGARVSSLIAVPTGLIAAGLLASWSRGGWMGFGAAGLVMLLLLPRRAVHGLLLVVVMGVVGGGLALTGRLPAALMARLTGFTAYARFQDVRGVGITDENFAVIERMAHWQAALDMWRARFWGGVGLGGYEAAYSAYALINWPLPLGHAHNFYLNMLAEVGLLGVVAYLTWLITMGMSSVWAARRTEGWIRGLAVGLVGSWTHLAVHSLVDNLLVNNVHLYVGVLAGLTAWVVLVARDRATSPTVR